LPTGAAANGMFLNTATPSSLPGAPWISPCWVRTGPASSEAPEPAPSVVAQAVSAPAMMAPAKAMRSDLTTFMNPLPCSTFSCCVAAPAARGRRRRVRLGDLFPAPGAVGGDVVADLHVALVAGVLEEAVLVVARDIHSHGERGLPHDRVRQGH